MEDCTFILDSNSPTGYVEIHDTQPVALAPVETLPPKAAPIKRKRGFAGIKERDPNYMNEISRKGSYSSVQTRREKASLRKAVLQREQRKKVHEYIDDKLYDLFLAAAEEFEEEEKEHTIVKKGPKNTSACDNHTKRKVKCPDECPGRKPLRDSKTSSKTQGEVGLMTSIPAHHWSIVMNSVFLDAIKYE